MPTVAFTEEADAVKGFDAILKAGGSVIFTEEERTFIVAEKMLEVLASKDIDFQIVRNRSLKPRKKKE